MPRPRRLPPREHSAAWPDEPCTDPDAEAIRQVVIQLRAALAGRSLREAERDTGVEHTVIQGLLAGRTWPEVVTVARLARALGVSLWPPTV